MYCACGNRCVVKINGRFKVDKDHHLCKRCFANQQNKLQTQELVKLSWKERSKALSSVILNKEISLLGAEGRELNSDITCKIILSDFSAVALFEGTDYCIPSLSYVWNGFTYKYVKHWFVKVLDDPSVFSLSEIKINAVGNWTDHYESLGIKLES